MRLGKHLALSGVASRRRSEALIAEGRVSVAGEVVTDPARDVDGNVAVSVDGRVLAGWEEPVVYAVNKPVGVLSTANDPFGRPIVTDLVRQSARLYPVGRLDLDSCGLILLSNDGRLAHALTHPSFEVEKTYVVEVAGGEVSDAALEALRDGVELEDGMTARARVRRIRDGGVGPGGGAVGGGECPAGVRLEIAIKEGRNRQVRRMCAAVGHEVVSLERVAFGPLLLGDLRRGASRRLDESEVARLRDAAGVPALEECRR